jgi:hypothetical protein
MTSTPHESQSSEPTPKHDSLFRRLLPVLGTFVGCGLVIFAALRTTSGHAVLQHLAEFRGPPLVTLSGGWHRADGSRDAGFRFSDENGALTGTAAVPGGTARVHGFRDGARAWLAFDGASAGSPRFNFVLVAVDTGLLQIRRKTSAGGWEQSNVAFARDTPHMEGR